MVALVLEALEFSNIIYKNREGVDMIVQYVTGPLLVPYFVLRFGIGAILPFLLLTYMIWRGTSGKALIAGATISACLVLLSVFMMRWNVVIGAFLIDHVASAESPRVSTGVQQPIDNTA